MPSEYVLTLGILVIVVGLPVLFAFVLKLNKQKHEQKTSKGVDLDQKETKIHGKTHRSARDDYNGKTQLTQFLQKNET